MKIKGMIFAAGIGSRLTPFTLTAPKALVPVAGVPMLQRVIEKFRNAGICDIVVNVHHFAEQIKTFLAENHNFGVNIQISDESNLLLDTGGALVHAYNLLADADAVLIHNADILTDFDLNNMIDEFTRNQSVAMLLTDRRQSSRRLYFGVGTRRLVGWEDTKTDRTLPQGFVPAEVPDIEPLAFGGVHIISHRLLDALTQYTDREVFSIIPFYADLCRELPILAYTPRHSFIWHDVGTPDKLQSATAAAAESDKQRLLDTRYLRMAQIWSENSYCRRRRVGAIIVKDKMIISDGFNGTPSGFENVCEDETDHTKPYVLHAEANALTKVARSNNSSEGATLYVTSSPCLECSKLIIQSGIRRVVYDELYRLSDGLDLLRRAGIDCVHLPLTH